MEVAMKHLIIAAIILVGVGIQPTAATLPSFQPIQNEQIRAALPQSQSNQALSTTEMATTVGGDNLTGCSAYIDPTGDLHYMCCLDLWIFSLCFDANIGRVGRWLDELF